MIKVNIEKLRQVKLLELNRYLAGTLAKTDWAVIKCTDLGLNFEETYPSIKEERDNVRKKCKEIEESLISATTVAEITAIEVPKIETQGLQRPFI